MTNLLRILFLLDFFPTKFTDNGSDHKFEKGGENHFDHIPDDISPLDLQQNSRCQNPITSHDGLWALCFSYHISQHSFVLSQLWYS